MRGDPRFDASASWGPDDAIVFVSSEGTRVFRVSANGGTPELIAEVEAGEIAKSPQLSPDGNTLLFTIGTWADWESARITTQSIETGERRILLDGGADAHYVPSGHLVYARNTTLLAVRFDWERLRISSGAVPVQDNVRPARLPNNNLTGTWKFSVSDTGSLVFVPSTTQELVWVDREGGLESVTAPADDYYYPRVAPQGDRVAFVSGRDLWIFNLRRATASRLTFTEDNNWPTWTPDGTRVIFSSLREGAENLFSRDADGSGDALRLTTNERKHRPESVSPDGSVLTYREEHPTDGWDVWKLRLDGDGAPVPFRATRFQEYGTVFSPDGRWIAFTSNESGEYEVYVVPASGAGEKTLVSTGGGGGPIWARDGRELFYNTGKTMGVTLILTPQGHCQLRIGTTLSRVVTSAL